MQLADMPQEKTVYDSIWRLIEVNTCTVVYSTAMG